MSAASSGQRFADYFVLAGLDTQVGLEPDRLSGASLHISPLERSYKASILQHFPNNVEWNPFDEDAVRMLCLPRGLLFKKDSEPHEESFHSFLITREDGSRVYGAALTFYEEVTDTRICEAMQTLQNMHEAELALAQSRAKTPTYSMWEHGSSDGEEIQQLTNRKTFNLQRDTLIASKCMCLIMPLPFISTCKEYLKQLYKIAMQEKCSALPLESYIYNILYEVPLPPPGRTLRFACSAENITCQRPGPNEMPLFDFSLKEFFQLLGVENVVLLINCILQEQQILMISKDFQRFMLVAESALALFFPFVWQHVYVPILPASMMHFLDAPVPFIMGLHCETQEQINNLNLPSEASLCLVDIDNYKITVPEDIHELINKDNLIAEVRETLHKFKVVTTDPDDRDPADVSMQRRSSEISIRMLSNSLSTDNILKAKRKAISPGQSPKSQSPKSLSPVSTPPRAHSPKTPILDASRVSRHYRSKSSVDRTIAKSKSSTHLDSTKNARLAAIAAIAERTGIVASINKLEKSVSDTQLKTSEKESEEDDMFIFGEQAKEITRRQQHENEFNITIREIFANHFTQMILEYDTFIIPPQQDMEQWISNREQLQNFDKAAFLSDQPGNFLPFLASFLETQMFASFIDSKILSQWGEVDNRIAVFDQRIENMKNKFGVVRSPSYEKCSTLRNALQVHLRRSNSVDHLSTVPHNLDTQIERVIQEGFFPDLQSNALDDPHSKGVKQARVNWRLRERKQQHSEHLILNSALKQEGKKMRDKLAVSLKKYIQDSKQKSSQTSMAEKDSKESAHKAFVKRLLEECRLKTKRLLVHKMGQEAVDLGHSDVGVSGVEENTLIASLCDLLERVWSHGLLTRKGKSPLWSHLLAYQQAKQACDSGDYDSNRLTPVPSGTRSAESSPKPGRKGAHLRRRSQSPDPTAALLKSLQFIPTAGPDTSALLTDMRNVQKMTDIKTDIGQARAWTRLALEKRELAKHLRELLKDDRILRELYKDYAFLRTEDERDQFLYHMLSLTAVDFYCFTNCFSSTMTYKVVIVTGKHLGGSTSTANAWMTLAGEKGDTGHIQLPRGETEFRFKHQNIGVLTTLRIGHDNTGLAPAWFIEHVVVKNEVTGHLYRFPCGRWLAKNMDDGSTERLLVGEILHPGENGNLSEVCKMSPQRSKSPALPRRPSRAELKSKVPELQEKMADAVNNIVKYFYKPEKERGNLTYLLCGDNGLCQSLEKIFLYGFKSSRLFRNDFFIWDFIDKVHQQFVSDGNTYSSEDLRGAKRSFCAAITRINNASQTIGKDGKFQTFICLGTRDHLIHEWLCLLAQSPVTYQMYESSSFFRDPTLLLFLTEVLKSLLEFHITLESSLLKGIS